MFGFVRPDREELKVREWERFRAVYCGLCHSIRTHYGIMQTTLLSNDCTFLALVLDCTSGENIVCRKRCIMHPLRKRKCAQETQAFRHTAAVNVILNYHKILDTIADEKGIKRLGARILRCVMHRGYKKAASELPEFDRSARIHLSRLAELEKKRTPSLDIPANEFAEILRSAVPDTGGADYRILGEMFYHIGRWIYLTDACYDIKEDFRTGSYNPIILRYGLEKPELSAVRDVLRHTLMQSLAAAYHAYILLDIKKDSSITENILCRGLPNVTEQVLCGTFDNNGGKDSNGPL